MKVTHTSPSVLLPKLATLLCALTLSAHAQTRTWTGATNEDFNLRDNYSPGGGGQLPSNSDVVFNTPASPTMTAAVAVNSLLIESSADGFALGGNFNLVVHQGGVKIADGAHATFSNHLVSNTGATSLLFNVGEDSSLTARGRIHTQTILFQKQGSGALIFESGSQALAYQRGAFRFEEGLIHFAAGSTLGYDDPNEQRPDGRVAVLVGTSTTSATLTGSGQLNGIVNTSGANRSTFAPDGTLTIRHLIATSGARFNYTLGQDKITAGAFSDSTLNLSTTNQIEFGFSGGEAGVEYTLFENYQSLIANISHWSLISNGYVLDESYGAGGWLIDDHSVKVRFSAIPEPSSALFISLGAVLSLTLLRRDSPSSPLRP